MIFFLLFITQLRNGSAAIKSSLGSKLETQSNQNVNKYGGHKNMLFTEKDNTIQHSIYKERTHWQIVVLNEFVNQNVRGFSFE